MAGRRRIARSRVAGTGDAAAGRAATLEAKIAGYAAEHGFSGVVLARHDGEVVYHRSFGLADRAFDVPATTQTRFAIASITKAFTAVLILQLHEQGKLDLQAPIGDYLPDYAGEGAVKVTVHQLLNHTSGIRNSDTVGSYEEAVRNGMPQYQLPHTSDDLVAKYASGPLVHAPGTAFDYNNADYLIQGKIVERLTGRTFEQTLEERILAPLAMADAGMLHQKDVLPRLARTYLKIGADEPLIHDLPVYMENWYAAGGMYSTTADLLKFADALYGSTLLKRESLKRMLEPGLDEYGYGLWVRDIEVHGKTHSVAQRPGRIMGANTILLHVLDGGPTVVILGNTSATDIDAFAYMIARTLLD